MKIHLHIEEITVDGFAASAGLEAELAAALRGNLAPMLAGAPGFESWRLMSGESLDVAPVDLNSRAAGREIGVATAQALGGGLLP